VACWSRSSDLFGRVWRALALVFLAVQHRWQVLWHGRRWELGISYNKATIFFLRRFPELVLLRSIRRSPVRFPVMPLRWWSGAGNETGRTFFNKRNLLWYGGLSLLLFSPLFGHGGAERGEWRAIICRCGGVGGESSTSELIHADGSSADAILCRQGGVCSTSIAEAI
jgi:hypothetical protein